MNPRLEQRRAPQTARGFAWTNLPLCTDARVRHERSAQADITWS
jgi:hypothetical protein